MAKEVTHANRFKDPIQREIGPDRELFVLICDDKSVYEFQKLEDSPIWNLRSRGDFDEDSHYWTTRSAPLPADVREKLNDELGKGKWTK